jgi:putative membrane protein
MLRTVLSVLATALSLLVVDLIFPGVNLVNFPAALLAGAVIGAINATIKPGLKLLSLPLTIISLGAFALVINGIFFWLSSIFVPGFKVSGLVAFILAPILLTLINTFLTNYFAEKYPSQS